MNKLINNQYYQENFQEINLLEILKAFLLMLKMIKK